MANVYLLVAVSKRSIIIDALLSKIHRETREIFQISFEICRHIRNYMYNLHGITYTFSSSNVLKILFLFFGPVSRPKVEKSIRLFSTLHAVLLYTYIYIFTINFFRLINSSSR